MNRPSRARWLLALIVGAELVGGIGLHAQTESAADFLWVGRFSDSAAEGLPEHWEALKFPKIPKHTEYALVENDGRVVIRAESRAAASGLVRKIKIDLREFPVVSWQWRVDNTIPSSDVTRKDGDDYAARLYITFEYDPDRATFGQKAKYRLGRLLFGDVPIASIAYIWETRTPVGSIVDNPYTDLLKMIVVESGDDKIGRWVSEERNLYEDYKKAFGQEPTQVNSVAIMTDTDNTRESAVAFYGDILFRKAH